MRKEKLFKFYIIFILARNGEARGTSPETSPEGASSGCWWSPLSAMGCFGSSNPKQTDSNNSDDSKSQKRRSDAITKQLQKDKQVIIAFKHATITALMFSKFSFQLFRYIERHIDYCCSVPVSQANRQLLSKCEYYT